MKNYLMMIAASAAVLFASCSANDELVEDIHTSSRNAIGFNVVSNNAQTRANIYDSKSFNNKSFNVWAITSGQSPVVFMNNVKVSYSSNAWNTPETYYWPAEGTLDFYAVYPENVTPSITASGDKKIEYTINTDNSKNEDVLYASAFGESNKTNGSINTNKTVKLLFKHLLSQITFKGRTISSGMSVEISNMKLHNVANKGTYTLSTSSQWSLSATGTEDYPLVSNGNITINNKETTSDIVADKDAWLMIPQTTTAWTPAVITQNTTGCYLELTCKITQNSVVVYDGTAEGNHLFVPFTPNWESGKKYAYTIVFGGGYNSNGQSVLNPIQFEVKTTDMDWTSTSLSEINGSNK